MRINPTILLATTAALALSACKTSLQTRIYDVPPTEKPVGSDNKVKGFNSALRGMPYALPMRQYAVNVTRRVMSCNTPITLELDGKSVPLPKAYVLPTLALEMKATAKSTIVEGEQYLIDYEKLSSGTKTTSFDIGFHEGTMLLKTVNASADDQTGDIIAKTLGAGLAIAGTVAAPGAGAAIMGGLAAVKSASVMGFDGTQSKGQLEILLDILNDSTIDNAVDCSDDVAKTLQDRAKLNTEIKRLSEGNIYPEGVKAAKGAAVPLPDDTTLADLNDRLTALLPYIGVQPVPSSISDELPVLLRWQAQVVAAIRANKASRDTLDKDITATISKDWPEKSDVRGAANFANLDKDGQKPFFDLFIMKSHLVIDQNKLAKNLSEDKSKLNNLRKAFPEFIDAYVDRDGNARTKLTSPSLTCSGLQATVETCVADLSKIRAQLQLATISTPPVDTENKPPPTSDQDKKRSEALKKSVEIWPDAKVDGLLIRQPVMGKLLICPGAPANGCKEIDSLNEVTAELIPQMGQLRLLPLVNGPFEKNGISVEVAKDGRLVSFSYKSERAIAAAIAASANDAASQFKDFKDSQAKAKKDAKDTKIAELQYQIDLAEKSDKVKALGTPKSAAELKAADDTQNATFLKAQLTALIVQQCLDRAKAHPDTPTSCPD